MTTTKATKVKAEVAGDWQVLILDGIQPPTLNQLMRGRIRDRIRLGKAFRAIVIGMARNQGLVPAKGKRRVNICVTLPKGKRAPDPDALYKSVGDSLVKAGLLKGDSYRWVQWGTVEFLRGSELSTSIYLEDL
jgi:hypothetical protein